MFVYEVWILFQLKNKNKASFLRERRKKKYEQKAIKSTFNISVWNHNHSDSIQYVESGKATEKNVVAKIQA